MLLSDCEYQAARSQHDTQGQHEQWRLSLQYLNFVIADLGIFRPIAPHLNMISDLLRAASFGN